MEGQLRQYQDSNHEDEAGARQHATGCPADDEGTADQPGGREGQLDVASDLEYAL